MNMDKILVIALGVSAIGFVYWFFFMKKERAVAAGNEVEVVVDGGYTPETITLQRGRKTTLTFIRKDPSSCLEEIVIPDFKIKKMLPLNQRVSVEITPTETGRFQMSCGMNMFHGTLIVQS